MRLQCDIGVLLFCVGMTEGRTTRRDESRQSRSQSTLEETWSTLTWWRAWTTHCWRRSVLWGYFSQSYRIRQRVVQFHVKDMTVRVRKASLCIKIYYGGVYQVWMSMCLSRVEICSNVHQAWMFIFYYLWVDIWCYNISVAWMPVFHYLCLILVDIFLFGANMEVLRRM